jgi:hypothetical protein
LVIGKKENKKGKNSLLGIDILQFLIKSDSFGQKILIFVDQSAKSLILKGVAQKDVEIGQKLAPILHFFPIFQLIKQILYNYSVGAQFFYDLRV